MPAPRRSRLRSLRTSSLGWKGYRMQPSSGEEDSLPMNRMEIRKDTSVVVALEPSTSTQDVGYDFDCGPQQRHA